MGWQEGSTGRPEASGSEVRVLLKRYRAGNGKPRLDSVWDMQVRFLPHL